MTARRRPHTHDGTSARASRAWHTHHHISLHHRSTRWRPAPCRTLHHLSPPTRQWPAAAGSQSWLPLPSSPPARLAPAQCRTSHCTLLGPADSGREPVPALLPSRLATGSAGSCFLPPQPSRGTTGSSSRHYHGQLSFHTVARASKSTAATVAVVQPRPLAP